MHISNYNLFRIFLVCFAFLVLQGVNVFTVAICSVMAIAVCILAYTVMIDEIKG